MTAPSWTVAGRWTLALATAAVLRLAWGVLGPGFPLWLAAGLGAVALAGGVARRLPVGPDKYEIVSFFQRLGARLGLCALLFAALVGLEGAVRLAGDFGFLIRYPFSVNVLDGREPSKAWLLMHGLGIYPHLDGNHLLVTLYNPLYHMVLAGFFSVFHDLFAVARTVNAVLALALLGLVWRMGASGGGDWKIAGLVTALFALSEPFGFSRFTRPDVLAWVLAFGGLGLAGRAGGCLGRDGGVLAAGIFFGLAYLTKQQSLPFALGAGLWLAWVGLWGRLWRLAAGFCATAGLGLGCEWLLTHATVFEHTLAYPRLIASNPRITSLSRGALAMGGFFSSHWPLLAAWACTLPGRKGLRDVRIEEAAFLANLPFLTVLLGTWGADANYVLSALGLLCVLAARGLARLGRCGPVWGLLGVALLIAALPGVPPQGNDRTDAAALRQARNEQSDLRRAVLDAPGPVLADVEGAPAFLGGVPLKKVMLYDAVELGAQAWAMGRTLTDSGLLRDLKARRFALVVNSRTLHAREYTLVLHRYYELARTIGPYELYRPRPALAMLELAGAGQSGGLGPWTVWGRGVSARVAQTRNLARVPGRDCWCVDDKRGEGDLRVDVDAPAGDGPLAFELGVNAMLSAPGGAVELLVGPGGSGTAPVAGFGAVGVKNFDTVWSDPVRASGEWPGGALSLLLRLRGNAMLCMNRDNPGWFAVTPTGGADAKKR